MITYDQMVEEVTARLGGRTDISGRINRWINYSVYELLLSPRFNFYELDAFTTFNTVVGKATYGLEVDAGLTKDKFWLILDIRDNTQQIHLERIHYQVMDRVSQVPGLPYRYYRFEEDITLDPIPNVVSEIQIRYRRRFEIGPPSTFLNLGSEWEEPIVLLATLKGWEALDQRDKAAEQRSLLEPILMMRQDVLALEDGVDSENTVEPVYDEFRY